MTIGELGVDGLVLWAVDDETARVLSQTSLGDHLQRVGAAFHQAIEARLVPPMRRRSARASSGSGTCTGLDATSTGGPAEAEDGSGGAWPATGELGAQRRHPELGRGPGKPDTFNVLGFTHICGQTRSGRFRVLWQTIRQRVQAT